MKLGALTWVEVEEYLEQESSIIVPVGTCEQHGRHLPLNTDTLVAEYIADFLSEETGIVVAPTVTYGVNLPCDRFFGGTCSLSEPVLRQLLLSVVEWWEMQGFRDFMVLSAHGVPSHVRALSESGKDNVHVLELYDLPLEGILDRQKNVKHACEAETSVMLYLCPDQVREGAAEDFELPFDELKDYLERGKTDPIPGSPGNLGYPSAATREKGQQIVSRMKERALRWIQETGESRERSGLFRKEKHGQATGG